MWLGAFNGHRHHVCTCTGLPRYHFRGVPDAAKPVPPLQWRANVADSLLMGLYQETVAWITRLIRQPVGELTRAQRRVRYAVDLARHCARQLQRDRASHIAAALTYRTLFSLVPVAVMSMLIVRALVSREQARETALAQAYALFDVAGNGVLTPTDLEVRERIEEVVNPIIQNAWSLNFGSIGAVGMLVLIWAALALLVTVETAFNTVYKAPAGRPWRMRIPIYWAVVTLGPLLLFVSFYMADQLFHFLAELGPFGPMLSRLSTFTALAATWLLLVILYTMMPTAKVHLRPAMIGAFVAAILWELGKYGFGLYVSGAVRDNVYGTLGLVPLFLLWLYVSWLIVLFGLELSYALQTLPRHRLRLAALDEPTQGVWDPRWLLPMMVTICRSFAAGRTIGAESMARSLSIPIAASRELVGRLAKAGLVRSVADDGPTGGFEEGLVPARPPNQITVTEVLDLADLIARPSTASQAGSSRPAWSLLDRLTESQRELTRDTTLADLITTDVSGTADTAEPQESPGKTAPSPPDDGTHTTSTPEAAPIPRT